jgi:hypothetical protein
MTVSELTSGKPSALGMVLGDSTEVRMGITYEQVRVGEDRGSKEMDGCPLTVSAVKSSSIQDYCYCGYLSMTY